MVIPLSPQSRLKLWKSEQLRNASPRGIIGIADSDQGEKIKVITAKKERKGEQPLLFVFTPEPCAGWVSLHKFKKLFGQLP